MKKNFLYSMMAVFAMSFASCSQEEIVSTATGDEPTAGQLVRISASLPQEAASRGMTTVTDYKARCIMQLVDASGVAIEGQRYVEEVTGDQVTFEFTAPGQDYQCVFWADYIQESAPSMETDYFYTTTALPAVTLGKLNKNVMFGTEAADAFCGVITDPSNGLNITLKRPLAKVNIGSNTPENYAGYDQVTVGRMQIPNNYNILTKTTDVATTQEIRLDATSMINADAGEWTYFFVFAPVDQTNYTFDIPVTITDAAGSLEGKSATVSIVPVDDNVESNINFTPEGGSGEEPEPEPGNDMQINVSFDNEYEETADPNALAVGDYIDATGAKVTDASSAVAIVFALANGVTDNSNYEGKTVEGYAIALENASNRTYLKNGSSGTWDSSLTATNDATNDYSGYTYSQALMASLEAQTESSILTSYNTWLGEHTTSGNLSTWYIPTYDQATAALSSVDPALAAALQEVRANGTWVLTSSVNADGTSIKGVLYTPTNATTGTVKEATIGTDGQAVIVPVVTIFE